MDAVTELNPEPKVRRGKVKRRHVILGVLLVLAAGARFVSHYWIARTMGTSPAGCEIFLADIYDPTDGAGTAWVVGYPSWPDGLAVHKEYNQVIRAAARRHPNVHLVEMHSALLGHGFYSRQFWMPQYQRADPTCWYQDNFEDPNDRGYDAIRRAFLVEMVRQRDRLVAPSPTEITQVSGLEQQRTLER